MGSTEQKGEREAEGEERAGGCEHGRISECLPYSRPYSGPYRAGHGVRKPEKPDACADSLFRDDEGRERNDHG